MRRRQVTVETDSYLGSYYNAGGSEVVSVITKTSTDSLGLTMGKEVYAVIKATSVRVAID